MAKRTISQLRGAFYDSLTRLGNVTTPGGSGHAGEYDQAATNRLNSLKAGTVLPGTGMIDNAFQPTGGMVTREVFEQVYGTDQEVYDRLGKFETKYFNELSKYRSAGGNVDVDLVRASGEIDLSILPKGTAQGLMNEYMSDVLRFTDSAAMAGDVIGSTGPSLPSLAGLPGHQIRSTNNFTDAVFRYVIDQRGAAPGPNNYNPMQVVLNAINFNYSSTRQEANAVGIASKLPSLSTIKSAMADFSSAPTANITKSLMLDLETTGVTRGSVVRSLTLSEMILNPDGSKSVNVLHNFSFDSPSMRSLRDMGVKGQGMARGLAAKEGTDFIDVGEGGKNVVDKLTEVLEMMADPEYERLIAHNSRFDISMLLSTMDKQEAYGSSDRAIEAVRAFVERRDSDPLFVRDTLHKSRTYMLDQANQIVENYRQANPNATADEIDKLRFATMMADEKLPLLKPTETVSIAGLETIATNTNLFELMEQDVNARKLFESMEKGSHIAEVDNILTAYVDTYIDEGKLSIWPLTQQQGLSGPGYEKTAVGEFLRNVVIRSKAVTATTNIIDPSNLSGYLTDRVLGASDADALGALRGTTVRVIGDDSQMETSLRSLGLDDSYKKGVINVGSDGRIYASKLGAEIGDNLTVASDALDDQEAGLRFIQRTIRDAKDSRSPKIVARTATGQVLSDNLALQSIESLGVSYGTNQAIDDLGVITNKVPGLGRYSPAISSSNIGKAAQADILEEGLTAVYRTLGTPENIPKGISPRNTGREAAPVLRGGMAAYNTDDIAQMATSLRDIGDPFYFLDARSRYAGSYLAGLTANQASNMYMEASPDAQKSSILGLFNPKRKELGLIEGLGVVMGKQVEKDYVRIVGENPIEGRTVPVLSADAFDIISENAGVDLSKLNERKFSTAVDFEGNKFVNVKTIINDVAESEKLAKEIVETFTDESKVAALAKRLGYDDADIKLGSSLGYDRVNAKSNALFEQFKKMSAAVEADGANKDLLARRIADNISELGVVTERLGKSDEIYDATISLMETMGLNPRNDTEGLTARRVFGVEGGSGYVVYDQDAISRAGLTDQLDEATETAEAGYERLAKNIRRLSDTDLLNDVSREAGYSRTGKVAQSLQNAADSIKSFMKPVIEATPGGSKTLAGVAGAAVLGLMAYNSSRQNEIYNQTVEKQPYEPTNYIRSENESLAYLSPTPSSRRDPLSTAGVVGNLDRNKINHTRMGNNKYDHLF